MVQTPAVRRPACWAALILALCASAAGAAEAASTPPPAAAADPTQPQASVPPAVHRSAFARYRPLATTPVPWREANDTVNRIGGWRAYAREAAQPEAAPATPAAPPAAAPAAAPAPAKPKEHRHAH